MSSPACAHTHRHTHTRIHTHSDMYTRMSSDRADEKDGKPESRPCQLLSFQASEEASVPGCKHVGQGPRCFCCKPAQHTYRFRQEQEEAQKIGTLILKSRGKVLMKPKTIKVLSVLWMPTTTSHSLGQKEYLSTSK